MHNLDRFSQYSVVAVGLLLSLVTPALAGTTTRVSVGPGGVEGNGASSSPAIAADGRTVVFLSSATNLVPGDTNGVVDLFTYDRQLHTTARLFPSPGGHIAGPAISGNGRYVAFWSDANLVSNDVKYGDIFVHDRQLGQTTRVSVGPGGAAPNSTSYSGASISADGRYVAFSSGATNLVAGLNAHSRQIYRYDRVTRTNQCVSLKPDGTSAVSGSLGFETAISANGRYVLFYGVASDLVAGDTNATTDVFVRDMQERKTVRVSVGSHGIQGNEGACNGERPAISADGRYVAFCSLASNLIANDTNNSTDIFFRDLQLGVTTRVNLGPGNSQSIGQAHSPTISSDGRFVAFYSSAHDLVFGDHALAEEVFIRDRQLQTTQRISIPQGGGDANNFSRYPAISADGSVVTFYSAASNLVAADTNRQHDIFVRSR